MQFPGKIALAAGAGLLVVSTDLQAQEDTVVALEPIVLEGQQGPTAPVEGFVAGSSATATKTGTPLIETQQSVSVITGDQIAAQGAATLGQALNYSAGIVGEPYGADPRFNSPTLRGFDGRQSQYLDGLKIMRASGAPALELYGLERVEVLRGPSSVLYGAGSPAGIINQISKRAQFDDFGEAGLGFGSYDHRELFFDVNRGLAPTLALRLTGVARQSDEQVEELSSDSGYLGAALTWRASEATTFSFLGSLRSDAPSSPSSIPAELSLTGANPISPGFYVGEEGADDSDRDMVNLGFELHHEFESGWALDQNFRAQKFDWTYASVYFSSLAEDGRTINRGAIYQDEDTSTLNVDTRLSGEVQTGAARHRLLFGIDVRHYDDDTTTEFGYAPTLDAIDPVYGAPVPKDVWYTSVQDLTLKQVGLYAQDEISFGNWRGTLGLRHDWVEQEGTSYTNFAGTSEVSQRDEAFTGRAGLSYLFANGLAPFVSYATSFEPVVGTDPEGNALQPTEGQQWELGLKYQPTMFDGYFTASVYDLTQQNVTTRVLEDGVPVDRQVGEMRSRGLELEAVASFAEGWDLRAAYSYTDAEKQGGAIDGLAPANVPEHAASLWLGHRFAAGSALEGFGAGAGARYVGTRYGDESNLFEMEAVTLYDAALTWERGNAEASLNVLNLTDEDYVANCGTFGCTYGDGRALLAKLAYTW